MKNKISRVWGVADNIPIIFTPGTGENQWVVSLPTDFTDGQYACEIHAEDIHGRRAMWCGTLFIHQGKACLHLIPTKAVIWAEPPKISIVPTSGKEVFVSLESFAFLPFVCKKITFEGSCKCGTIPIHSR